MLSHQQSLTMKNSFPKLTIYSEKHICLGSRKHFFCCSCFIIGRTHTAMFLDHPGSAQGNHMGCQRYNLGQVHARLVSYSLYYRCGPIAQKLFIQPQILNYMDIPKPKPLKCCSGLPNACQTFKFPPIYKQDGNVSFYVHSCNI